MTEGATPDDPTPAEASPVEAPSTPAPEPIPGPVLPPETPLPSVAALTETADQRKASLDAALTRFGAAGWRIETRSDFQATIAKGHRINHILHLILTLVTLGFWAIVWILMAIFGGEKRRMVTVDEYGNIIDSKI